MTLPKRYFIRALKSILLCFLLALLIFALAYITSSQRDTLTFWQLIERSNPTKMMLFLGLFGLIYPFIGYISQKVTRNRELTAVDMENIKKLFADNRYKLISDENGKLIFRTVNPAARVTRMFEDAIEVDYSSNPMTVDGLRRDAARLGRGIEWYLRKADQSSGSEE